MDHEKISKELLDQQELINKIFISVEKTRKYFLWTTIITVVVFVLPLIAMIFVLPTFISTYSDILSGVSLGL